MYLCVKNTVYDAMQLSADGRGKGRMTVMRKEREEVKKEEAGRKGEIKGEGGRSENSPGREREGGKVMRDRMKGGKEGEIVMMQRGG